MKKYISVLILLLLFTSCSQNKRRYVIGVSQCSEDSWRQKLNAELKREAFFYDKVEVRFSSANDDNKKQISQIKKFVDDGVDLLIVSPNEAKAITPAVDEAYNKGIPVVLVDRKTNSKKYTAFIGANNYDIGRTVGEYIAAKLKGKGNIVEIQGLVGASSAIERHNGFVSAIKKFPDLHLIASKHAGWLQQPARKVMDSVVLGNEVINCVFGQNDRMAKGAYQAVHNSKHRDDNTMFVGIDALSTPDGGIKAVEDGVLSATFIYPTCGDRVMRLAMNILAGKTYQKDNTLYTALVDKGNAKIISLQSNEISNQDKKLETLHGKVDLYFTQYSNQKVYLVLFIIIIVLLTIFGVYIYRAYWTKRKLYLLLEKRNNENEKQKSALQEGNDKLIKLSKELEEATHAKLVFFTNVSHDFRTPLTLIADPVEQLMNDSELTNHQHSLLNIVHKNVNILLRLINEILNFRKIENGKAEINFSNVKILPFFREWTDGFRSVALKKHIDLSLDIINIDEESVITADVEKLERIYFNLVGNAFKFTPENGKIKISISISCETDKKKAFHIEVSDSGIGISEEHLANIFERFYQVSVNNTGSGLGLALVKAFVDMHNGTISVKSTVGQGSTFFITIPLEQEIVGTSGEKQINLEQLHEIEKEEVEVNTNALPEEIHASEVTKPITYQDTDKPLLLVIDDNQDIRGYISSLISDKYSVIEAFDGQDGLAKAGKVGPEVIIGAVMRPVMDGWECCKRLKSGIQTSHIPVLMLTACSLDEQRIEGFECGADSYIAKPFSNKLLMARIENLLENRRRLKKVFGNDIEKSDVSDLDKNFITRFRECLHNHLSDSELSVESLCEELGLSRVQTYRKIKALTNYSPVELIRIARLERANQLLMATDKTVSEIAYEVGFSAPSYFTKCYKDYYGVNPNEKQKGALNN